MGDGKLLARHLARPLIGGIIFWVFVVLLVSGMTAIWGVPISGPFSSFADIALRAGWGTLIWGALLAAWTKKLRFIWIGTSFSLLIVMALFLLLDSDHGVWNASGYGVETDLFLLGLLAIATPIKWVWRVTRKHGAHWRTALANSLESWKHPERVGPND